MIGRRHAQDEVTERGERRPGDPREEYGRGRPLLGRRSYSRSQNPVKNPFPGGKGPKNPRSETESAPADYPL
jgi:hypothetical protein